MARRIGFELGVLLGVLWLGGCESDAGSEDAATPSADGGPRLDGGADTLDAEDATTPAPEPGPPITLTGHVNGGLFTMARDPVSVCVHAPEGFGCVDTDDLGYYAIEAPSETPVALRIEGQGLIPTLRVVLTLDEDLELGNTRVMGLGGLTPIAEQVGVELDPDKGAIFFGGVEFVSAELLPPSGQRYYATLAGQVQDGAEWLELRGSGGFLNVEPGRTAIRFSRPHIPCAFNRTNTLSGWPDPEDHTLAVVPVLAGHNVSTISMDCGAP